MNEYRQTKEYQGSSEGRKYLDDLENTKEYKLSDQGGEYTVPHKGADPSEHDDDVYPEDRKYITNAYHKQHIKRDYVEEAKIEIVDKITKHFQDVMFEMVSEEMGKTYVFQRQNYLTDAGYELFEDEWFEFYHEHHGDVLYEVMQNITN